MWIFSAIAQFLIHVVDKHQSIGEAMLAPRIHCSLGGRVSLEAERFPDDTFIDTLLQRYYFPYHKKLDNLLENRNIILALDCHSMLQSSPPISDNPGVPRPLICLSNRG